MLSPEQKNLGQCMTPFWAAQKLLEQFFELDGSDIVLEPTCGTGAFLGAVPTHVRAIGVEIDPQLAAQARKNTDRPVICTDIRSLSLDVEPTVAIGNPPFQTGLFQAILDKLNQVMASDARAGFILPAYFFQYASTAKAYAEHWKIRTEQLPRSLFPGLTKPLVFALFEKSAHGQLIGFALYDEIEAINAMQARYKQLLGSAEKSVWQQVVIEAMFHLGGKASLQELYREIAPRRPTTNQWWQAKIRQIVQQLCRRVSRGCYVLDELLRERPGLQLRMML